MSQKTRQASFFGPAAVAVGYNGNEKLFTAMKDLLNGIGFFRVVASIGKALKEIYEAMRATAVSA